MMSFGFLVQQVNIGLGSSLAQSLEKADRGVRGFSSVKEKTVPAKQEPIMIGMAVIMPGSPNVGELWKLRGR